MAEEKTSEEEVLGLVYMEKADKALVETSDRNKMGKTNVGLRGVSTKKRNIWQLASPQKKMGSKNMVQIGDRLYPGKGRKPPRKRGGNATPKPND